MPLEARIDVVPHGVENRRETLVDVRISQVHQLDDDPGGERLYEAKGTAAVDGETGRRFSVVLTHRRDAGAAALVAAVLRADADAMSPPDLSVDPQVEEKWVTFWRDLVCTGGFLDIAKVKNELHDYSQMLHEVPRVYMDITGSQMSKPHYLADDVIRVHENHCPVAHFVRADVREILDGEGTDEEKIAALSDLIEGTST